MQRKRGTELIDKRRMVQTTVSETWKFQVSKQFSSEAERHRLY